MIIYYYDDLMIFANEGVAFENPLRSGDYIIPPKAVTFAPPAVGDHQVARLNAGKSAWELVADYRGTYYNTTTGEEVRITELGVTPSSDLADTPRPSEFYLWNVQTLQWVLDETAYRSSLESKCKSRIVNYADSLAESLALAEYPLAVRLAFDGKRRQAEDLEAGRITYQEATLLYRKAAKENGVTIPTEAMVLAEKDRVLAKVSQFEELCANLEVRTSLLIEALTALSMADLEAYDTKSRWEALMI